MWKLWAALFLCLFSIQLIYLIWMWWQWRKKSSKSTHTLPATSIIICAFNEAENLRIHIPHWCEQRYDGEYEVIIIDDQSTDDTLKILQAFQAKYPNLKCFTNPKTNGFPGKKSALDYGIQQATYDFLVFTDADCMPASQHWLDAMTQDSDKITLGFGDYEPKQTALNQWIRWETLHTCLQYSTYAKAQIPYMGVGRNIAYPKSVYQQALQSNAFLTIYTQVPSGDDDLLLQEMSRYAPTCVVNVTEGKTISKAPTDWSAYWKQKQRHTSTGKYYQHQVKYLLGLYGLTHGLFWLMGPPLVIYLIIKWYAGEITCGLQFFDDLYLAKIIIFVFVIKIILTCELLSRYNQALLSFKVSTYYKYAIGDLFWAIYNLIVAPFIFFKNKQRWK